MKDASTIREEMKNFRKGLSEEEILTLSKRIEEKLYEVIHAQNRKDILCFYPLEDEVNLLPLYEKFLKEGYRLYFPKSYPEEILFYQVDTMKDFKLGAFRIMEPYGTKERYIYHEIPSVCITPGLAFSKTHYRIGFGGGYYDKFLKYKDIYKIGVCFDSQILEFEPKNHDVDMDLVITDKNIY